jgi:hypothetical protein
MPPALLPHLCLIEICEGDRLKVRLVGTEIVRQHKRDNTGKFADEYLKGEYLAYLTALYLDLRARRLPVLAESRFRHIDTQLETTRLLVPLTMGVRLVLMGQVFRYRSGQANTPIAAARCRLAGGSQPDPARSREARRYAPTTTVERS